MKNSAAFTDRHITATMATFILFLITIVDGVQSTSLMKKIRDRSSTDFAENNGDRRIQTTPAVRDILISIDEKLTVDTMKLARIDYSMDQMIRRLASIETRLGRLESKFDIRLEKIESAMVSKDLREEFSSEHLSRKVENLSEKINSKAAYLDGKLDVKLERITGKLEILERDLHNSVDDIMERLVKSEEKCMAIENETEKRRQKLDEVQKQITDKRSLADEGFMTSMKNDCEQLNERVTKVETAVLHNGNTSEKAVNGIRDVMQSISERVLTAIQDNKHKIENLSSTIGQNERSRSQIYSTEVMTQEQQLENLTTILDTALKAHEARFMELDADVEMYTRKVINGIQQLWRTSDELKSDLSNTLEQGNRTREIVRQEFRRLHEQIEPLPKLEPKLTDISEDLNEKVSRLSATVDNSFATLLVAQNTFIDSCQRIQQEETQVYDILQKIVYEMRNRSITDIQKIRNELSSQSLEINKSLSNILNAVLEAANLTTFAIYDLITEVNRKSQCIIYKAEEMEWSAMESICRQLTLEEQFAVDDIITSKTREQNGMDVDKLQSEKAADTLHNSDSSHLQRTEDFSRADYEEY